MSLWQIRTWRGAWRGCRTGAARGAPPHQAVKTKADNAYENAQKRRPDEEQKKRHLKCGPFLRQAQRVEVETYHLAIFDRQRDQQCCGDEEN